MLKLALLLVVLVAVAACGTDRATDTTGDDATDDGGDIAASSLQQVIPVQDLSQSANDDQQIIAEFQARTEALEQRVRELEVSILALGAHNEQLRAGLNDLENSLATKSSVEQLRASVDNLQFCIEELDDAVDGHSHFFSISRYQVATADAFIYTQC